MSTYFFKSKDVKVSPTTNRGTYKLGTDEGSFVFNPEAKLNTEQNLTQPRGFANGKRNYVLSYTAAQTKQDGSEVDGTLECVIEGYYFKLKLPYDKFNESNTTKYTTLQLALKEKRITDMDPTWVLAPIRLEGTKLTVPLEDSLDSSDSVYENAQFLGLVALTSTTASALTKADTWSTHTPTKGNPINLKVHWSTLKFREDDGTIRSSALYSAVKASTVQIGTSEAPKAGTLLLGGTSIKLTQESGTPSVIETLTLTNVATPRNETDATRLKDIYIDLEFFKDLYGLSEDKVNNTN